MAPRMALWSCCAFSRTWMRARLSPCAAMAARLAIRASQAASSSPASAIARSSAWVSGAGSTSTSARSRTRARARAGAFFMSARAAAASDSWAATSPSAWSSMAAASPAARPRAPASERRQRCMARRLRSSRFSRLTSQLMSVRPSVSKPTQVARLTSCGWTAFQRSGQRRRATRRAIRRAASKASAAFSRAVTDQSCSTSMVSGAGGRWEARRARASRAARPASSRGPPSRWRPQASSTSARLSCRFSEKVGWPVRTAP